MESAGIRLAGPDEIQQEMERFFEHLGRWKRPVFFFEKAWQPRCDVTETDSEVRVTVDLGGVSPDSINIKVESGTLIIHGIRREPANDPESTYRMAEISYGPFERAIPLPDRVDPEQAQASYTDGFLEIRLPKIKKAPRREVPIDVTP